MDNKRNTLIAGALIGAVTGVFGAMLLQRRAEKTDSDVTLSTGEGLKLGLLVIGLLRAIASIGDD